MNEKDGTRIVESAFVKSGLETKTKGGGATYYIEVLVEERTKHMLVSDVYPFPVVAPIPLLSRFIWIPIGSTMPSPCCPKLPPSQPSFFSN